MFIRKDIDSNINIKKNNRYKLLINMAKFKQFLTETGDELINKRAENLTEETKQ